MNEHVRYLFCSMSLAIVVAMAFTPTSAQPSSDNSLFSANAFATQVDAGFLSTGPFKIISPHPYIDKLIRALSGSWAITLSFAPDETMPKGGSGRGEETFHAGPGGLSLIEEYHSTGDEGEMSGLGVFWPGNQPSTMQVVWCDSTKPNGCGVMKGGATWQGSRVVLEDESQADGKKVMFREVFSDISLNSFTQTLYQGESADDLKTFLTIKATRKDESQSKDKVSSLVPDPN